MPAYLMPLSVIIGLYLFLLCKKKTNVIIIKINNENHSERIYILESKVETLNDIVTVMFYDEVEYEKDDGTLN